MVLVFMRKVFVNCMSILFGIQFRVFLIVLICYLTMRCPRRFAVHTCSDLARVRITSNLMFYFLSTTIMPEWPRFMHNYKIPYHKIYYFEMWV